MKANAELSPDSSADFLLSYFLRRISSIIQSHDWSAPIQENVLTKAKATRGMMKVSS